MATIQNAAGSQTADVNSSSRLLVQPPTDGTNAAAVFLVGKSDLNSPSNTGSITGSSQGLLATADVNIEFEDNYVASAMVTSKWNQATSTMTVSVANNTLITNNGSSVASGTYVLGRTYRYFRIDRGADRVFANRAKLEVAPVTNNVVEIGAFIASATAAPTAGTFFRYGTDGVLRGVAISQGGTEYQTSPITMSTPTDFHDYVIVVGRSSVTFFLDELPVASLTIPTDAAAPVASESLPLAYRIYNSAATGSAQKLTLARHTSTTLGGTRRQDGPILRALAGDVCWQGVTGVSTGSQTANWANSAAPGASTLSNTTVTNTQLGGQFQFQCAAGAETDYLVFGFQVPAATLTNMGRTLIVKGVKIEAFVFTAGAIMTTANTLFWGATFGGTAVSLATAEVLTIKLNRRLFLGIQSLSTANAAIVGTKLETIDVKLDQPLAVNPGEFFSIIVKMPTGAGTTQPILRGGVLIDGAWE